MTITVVTGFEDPKLQEHKPFIERAHDAFAYLGVVGTVLHQEIKDNEPDVLAAGHVVESRDHNADIDGDDDDNKFNADHFPDAEKYKTFNKE